MPINQQGAEPLSAQVKADIKRRIQAGDFPVGDKIPSLRALAADYEVAELTVHAAVKELQFEGVLQSASGRGTYVRALPGEEAAEAEGLAATVESLRAEVAELRGRVESIERSQGGG